MRDDKFILKKIINTAIKIKKGITKELIIGDISIKRDWGYAEEYVEAMQLINRSQIKKDYLVCTGKSYSLQDIIEIIFSKLGLNWKNHIKSSKDLFRKSEIQSSKGNPQSIHHDLGWKANTNIYKLIDILIKYEIQKNRKI